MARTVRLTIPLALSCLAACFSLARNSPPEQHYVLGGVVQRAVEPPSLDSGSATVGVRRLQLAPYLATPFVVVRRGPHRITFAEGHRWGEDLEGGINRTVAGYLAVRAPSLAFDLAPWPIQARHDYLIQVHVVRFEGLAPEEPSAVDGEAHMLATWVIIRAQDESVLARGTTERREPGWRIGDYAGLVAMLDSGLDALAADLAAALGTMAAHP
jgi:hypothetical protein